MRLRLLLPILAATAFPLSTACSQAASEDEGTEDELVGGEASGAEDDNVLLLVKDGKPLCTATLVAPNVLVTAHHCLGIARNGRVATTFQPGEITVRLGGTPGEKAAAVVTKIWRPQVTEPAAAGTTGGAATGGAAGTPGTTGTGTTPTEPAATEGTRMESADIAAVLVQPLDPAFDRLRPRRVRDRSISETETVRVVGWNANGPDGRIASLKRMKRSGVDVLADATQKTRVESPSDSAITVTNKAREFVTEAVACQGDDGAPAFDDQGNLVGLVAAVAGPCAAGSLSVFTDVVAQRSFITGVIAEMQRLECSTDAKCATAGRICDVATFKCADGCRTGSVTCATGQRCAAPSETAGVPGVCSTGSPTTSSAGGDAGTVVTPIGDGGASTPAAASCTAQSCGGTTSAPKVCNAAKKECVAGCRVGASPGMCATGFDCKASAEDPTIGSCQAKAITAPAAPQLSPPARASEPAGSGGVSTGEDAPTSSAGADAGAKAKKKAAAKDEGGCTVGHVGSKSAAGGFALLAFALACIRRRRAA